MPEHGIHDFVCKMVLGKSYESLDKILDSPVRFVGGKKHRQYFHSYLGAVVIGLVASQSLEGGAAGFCHVLLDNLCSQNKNFERLLRFSAKNASQNKV